jgi:hypothetical protein
MKTILPAIASLFMLLCSESVLACWCRHEPLETEKKFRAAVAKELRQSAVVFSGTAVERNTSGLRFRVERVWKGSATDEIFFSRRVDPGYLSDGIREIFIDSCALLFKVGKTYLVYAYRVNGELFVSKCSRTQFLEDTERDINELNRLKPKLRAQSPRIPKWSGRASRRGVEILNGPSSRGSIEIPNDKAADHTLVEAEHARDLARAIAEAKSKPGSRIQRLCRHPIQAPPRTLGS